MNSTKNDNLLVINLNPVSLIISEVVSGQTIPGLPIKPGYTSITDLFLLKKRDIAFIQKHKQNSSLMNVLTSNNKPTSYILSLKHPNDDLLQCTILPITLSNSNNHIAEELLEDIENGQYEIFKPLLPSALLIMGHDSTIQAANSDLFDMFQLNPTKIFGTYFGNIFRCSAAERSKKKCGSFVHCQNCNFRNGILEILESRLSSLQMETDYEYATDRGNRTVRLKTTAAEIIYKDLTFVAVSLIEIK